MKYPIIARRLDDNTTIAAPEDTTNTTTLGPAFQLDLFMVFIGLWDESEVPGILE